MLFGSPRTAIAILGLTLSTFLAITAETLPIGLLPLIARGLDVPLPSVGLLVSAYALVVVVATIPLTRLTQRMPRRLLISTVLALFVIGTAASAAAPGFGFLLAGRVVTALAHAVFWAIVVPIAASLVDPAVRGRAVSSVYAGGSIATVLGVPFAIWLGQTVDWRAAFAGVSALGALAFAIVAGALPRTRGGRDERTTGTAPDRRAYVVLVIAAALTTSGALVAFTYVSPFLTDVGDVPSVAVAGVLLARGLAGLVAVLVIGRLVDRFPRGALPTALAVHLLGLVLLCIAGPVPSMSIVGSVLSGAGFAAFSAALGAEVLRVAPGSVEVATAGTSTAFNVGISSGAFVGGRTLSALGLAGVPAVGAVIAAAGFVPVLLTFRRSRISR